MKQESTPQRWPIVLLTVILLFQSCGKEDPSPVASKEDVYVAGYQYLSVDGNKIATYWKNDVPFRLADDQIESVAKDIVVTPAGDIYTVGFEDNGTSSQIAVLWKNNEKIPLTDGTRQADANAVVFADDKIYVCGWEYGVLDRAVAKYWVYDGTAVESVVSVTDGTRPVSANAITVTNGFVYVAGHEYAPERAMYDAKCWKVNGEGDVVAIVLSDQATYSQSWEIAVNTTDIYVVGYSGNTGFRSAKYWRVKADNQVEEVSLTDGTNDAFPYCIAITAEDMFIGGAERIDGVYLATGWKNGASMRFSQTADSRINACTAVNSDIYWAGYLTDAEGNSHATYWKNDESFTLGLGIAGSIYIDTK